MNIPLHRLLMYILIAGALPILFATQTHLTTRTRLNAAASRVEALQSAALQAERREGVNKAVRSHFLEADHFYIDRQIESLPLLVEEQNLLQKIASQRGIVANEKVLRRLEHLTTDNKLVFSEGVLQTTPLFQETTETLTHPVEIDIDDLRSLLAKVEGVDIGTASSGPGRPQLIITSFKLEKKKVSERNEVFELNLKLLKREYL